MKTEDLSRYMEWFRASFFVIAILLIPIMGSSSPEYLDAPESGFGLGKTGYIILIALLTFFLGVYLVFKIFTPKETSSESVFSHEFQYWYQMPNNNIPCLVNCELD